MAMEHICWLQVEVNSWFCNTRPLNFETNYSEICDHTQKHARDCMSMNYTLR